MDATELKSAQFRREREATWTELERLVGRVEKIGVRRMSADELFRLPHLHWATLSALSVARAISLDRALVAYLEALALRAHLCVHGSHAGLVPTLAAFFTRDFPHAVRQLRWAIVISTVTLALGMVAGTSMVLSNSELFYTMVPEWLAGDRNPAASTEDLRDALYETGGSVDNLNVFASFLFTHNAGVGMLSFALGIALGLPVFVLMLMNGATIGAVIALYLERGLGLELGGWLMIHGTTEILAIVLCGGAGLSLGAAVVFPDRHSRLATLAARGRTAGTVVLGAVAMLMVAAVLEGFGRQLVTDTGDRYLIGLAMLAFWLAYFSMAGRSRSAASMLRSPRGGRRR